MAAKKEVIRTDDFLFLYQKYRLLGAELGAEALYQLIDDAVCHVLDLGGSQGLLLGADGQADGDGLLAVGHLLAAVLVHELRAVEQLTDSEQLNGLAALLLEAAEHKMDSKKTLVQVVDLLEKQMDEKGLASLLAPGRPGDLARPRRQEIFACLNRCRELRF